MEHSAKEYSVMIDIKNMGVFFYIPIVIMIFCGLYIIFVEYEFNDAIVLIRKDFGIFPIMGISVWIFYIFEDLLDSNGKEMLLSIPYDDNNFGIFRVIKMTIVYILCFYFFLIIIIMLLNKDYVFQFNDIYLPIVSIFFYSGFSFFTILIVKNNLISFAIVGIFSVFMYSTRGGVSAYIYPFQWGNPNPYYNPVIVAIVLIIATVSLYLSAQLFFKDREFLMK